MKNRTYRDYGDSSSGGNRKKYLKRFADNINKRCEDLSAEIVNGKVKIKNE